GDDTLSGGEDPDTDYLFGGEGADVAVFNGNQLDYDIAVVRIFMGDESLRVFKVTNTTTQAFDYVGMDVERFQFLDGQIDAPAVPPVVLLDGQGNEVGAY